MDVLLSFPAMFSKGDSFSNFRFAYLEDSFHKMESTLLRKKFAQMGANFFLYVVTSIFMGGNNENDRVASPESLPIYLKSQVQASP